MDRVKQLEEIHKEALELFKRKNKDYGDAFADFGLLGILVRLNDKIKRAITITENSISLVEDEKIKDTLIDIHNYAAMGLMLAENTQ
jgi:hypothetical protein|tara:strand:+ start:72 stop:332 length:261 start_codon:yes stop_codon:yes gene_type:complete